METITPSSAEELARELARAVENGKAVRLAGAGSKVRMAGPLPAAEVEISTAGLGRLLQYEPRDLTISVEAGMPWAELDRLLAENGQTLPLDPPFFHKATVGGVIATNGSGPRRRLYGSARDMVIGMKFATCAGRIVQSGAMVVKSVAGLDIGKLLIGSFGTLGAIVSVNFKVAPRPPCTRTFAIPCRDAAEASSKVQSILGGVLQPAAVDLLNPAAARLLGREGWSLLVQAGGNAAVVDRYSRELPGAEILEGGQEAALWEQVREFAPRFLAGSDEASLVRLSCLLSEVGAALDGAPGPALARAASGVVYAGFSDAETASRWLAGETARGRQGVLEFGPPDRAGLNLWPEPGASLEPMREIKRLLDPANLLNKGRLYGQI